LRTLFLSKNSIKSDIRSAYRKIGASSRTQAVLWRVDHGFTPDNRRIDHWRDGP
jgi:DNA-binding CsgD family transcriptional regulator